MRVLQAAMSGNAFASKQKMLASKQKMHGVFCSEKAGLHVHTFMSVFDPCSEETAPPVETSKPIEDEPVRLSVVVVVVLAFLIHV